MRALFSRAGLPLGENQAEQFWRYYLLYEGSREALDLSRLRRFEDVVVKHFIDSAYITTLCDIPNPLLDVGTGAGFPGIPLKIMLPGLSLILAEPRGKRVLFLRKVVEELRLTDVEIYPHLVADHSFFEVNGVITRALEPAEETLRRAEPFLRHGGKVLLMKGPSVDEELGGLRSGLSGGFTLAADREYALPGTSFRRRLVVFEKTHPARKRTYRILTRAGETMGTVITSPVNKTYKELKALNASDGVKKTGKTIVAGRRQVLDVARQRSDLCDGLVIFDGLREEDDGINGLIRDFADSGRLVLLKKSLFNEIDQFATGAPLLVARTPALGPWDGACDDGCTLLVPFQDPANVGTVIRSAVAFGVGRAVLLREAAHPYHPRAVRSSSGAVFHLTLQRGPSIEEVGGICRERSLDILTLDREGEPVHSFSFPDRFLLLPGLEGPGLPGQLRARALGIPMSGGVESLNAAVAASIALYAWRTHRQSRGGGFTSP